MSLEDFMRDNKNDKKDNVKFTPVHSNASARDILDSMDSLFEEYGNGRSLDEIFAGGVYGKES